MDVIREQIKSALAQLESNAGVNGYLVIRRDGAPLLKSTPTGSDDLSKLLASSLGSFETLSQKLGAGTVSHVLFETDSAKILALGGSLAMLVFLLESRADESEVLPLAKEAEAKIEQILS